MVKASLIVPLYNFGGACNKLYAQEMHYEASLYNNEWLNQKIIFEVSQAYYRLLESQKIVQVVRQSLETLGEQKRISQDFYGQDLIQKNDLLLINLQMAQREQEFIQASHNVVITLARLNRLIGFPLDESTEIEDILEQSNWIGNLEGYISEAKACHPELYRPSNRKSKRLSILMKQKRESFIPPSMLFPTIAPLTTTLSLTHME